MLRIGICDDDSEARFLLKTSLERIAEARSIDILVMSSPRERIL